MLTQVKCCPYCKSKQLNSDTIEAKAALAGGKWVLMPETIEENGAVLIHCNSCTSEFWSDGYSIDADASFIEQAFA